MPPSAPTTTTRSGGARHTVRQHETDQRNGEIARRFDRAGPDRAVKRGAEETDDGGVDPAHDRLRVRSLAKAVPERQRADEDQQAGQENADQAQRRAGNAVRRRPDHGAEIGGKGEQRSRHRLRGAVAGQKRIVARPNPASRTHRATAAARHGRRRTPARRSGRTPSNKAIPDQLTKLRRTGRPTSKTKNTVSATNPARRETGITTCPLAERRRVAAQTRGRRRHQAGSHRSAPPTRC